MLITKLREETKASHNQLDHRLYPIIQSLSSAQSYGDLLAVFYGFYNPVYKLFDEYFKGGALISDYDERRKPSWILDDLHMLSIEQPTIEFCKDTPHIDNTAAALGAYYVLEGATMGGSVIAKKIAVNLGLNKDNNGLKFFSAYQESNGIMWKNFLNILNRFDDNEEATQKIINTAQQTFEQFGQWIMAHYDKTEQDANTDSQLNQLR